MFRFRSKSLETPSIADQSTDIHASISKKGDVVAGSAPDLLDEVVVDRPPNTTSTGDGKNIVVIDGTIEYDNLKKQSQEDDESLSLHTTKSDDSIAISDFFRTTEPDVTAEQSLTELSLQPSEVDVSCLPGLSPDTTKTVEGLAEDAELEGSAKGSSFASEKTLDDDEEDVAGAPPATERQNTASSMWLRIKVSCMISIATMIFLQSMAPFYDYQNADIVVENMNEAIFPELFVSELKTGRFSPIRVDPTAQGLRISENPLESKGPSYVNVRENKTTTTLDGVFVREDFISNGNRNEWSSTTTSGSIYFTIIGVASIFLCFSKMASTSNEPSSKVTEVGVSKASNLTQTSEELDPVTKKKAAVKTEPGLEGWDLSYYEQLKVDELRELLRVRKCKTLGKKAILIRRLAIVYKAELETLTVRQLRPMLKTKKCKQGGLKVDLIQRLVEAGM